MLQLNHGTMLHLNHGGGRAPAVYCDDVERIARRQGATREEAEHFRPSFFFSFFLFLFFTHTHTHTPVKVRRRDPSVVHFGAPSAGLQPRACLPSAPRGHT